MTELRKCEFLLTRTWRKMWLCY